MNKTQTFPLISTVFLFFWGGACICLFMRDTEKEREVETYAEGEEGSL